MEAEPDLIATDGQEPHLPEPDDATGAPVSAGPPAPDAPRPVQERLPLAGATEPIPFALTARARRVVAPGSLPDLEVVPGRSRKAVPARGPQDLDDPHDTRRLRARALRRAGVALDDIARELRVDELTVRAWVDEVVPVHTARRRLQAVPAAPSQATSETSAGRPQELADLRAVARDDARTRLRHDPGFASGLALVVALASTTAHTVTFSSRDRGFAGAALRWLRQVTDIPTGRIRVLVRIAPQAAADLAAHAWADALGVHPSQVAFTRWRRAPDATAEDATVRIADPELAATVAGWREALLELLPHPEAAPDQ